MSEGSVSDTSKFESAAADSETVVGSHDAAGETAGRALRHAREAAGMSLPAMASALKVPLPKLQALEDDDYAFFQDHVFMRALAMGFCRYLRVDPAPVMALLPRTQLKSLADSGGTINETYKERSFKGAGTPLGGSTGQGSRKVILAVLVLLAAAAAVYFVPRHQDGPTDAASGSAGATTTATTVVPSPAGTESAVAGLGATDSSAGAAAAMPGTVTDTVLHNAAVAGGPAVDGAAAVTAAAGAGATTASTAPAAATGAALLEVRSASQSWVRVKDANGKVVAEKTLNKGESLTAEGALPLSVIVGNAKGAQVTVRGEPLDIVKGMRDSVARFEVK